MVPAEQLEDRFLLRRVQVDAERTDVLDERVDQLVGVGPGGREVVAEGDSSTPLSG